MGVYDNFKVANYPDALLSPELFARHMSRLWSGEVIDGLTVTPGTGLQVILAAGNSFIRYGSANVASARLFSLVDTFALTIPTPDGSNPRIDLVVIYIDNDEDLPVTDPPTSANLDGLGVVKAKIVSGTANAVPVAPNGAAIQSSVGASNQYIVVAQVRTDAGVSVIAGNKITDVRSLASITASNINFGGSGTGVWWEEIGRTTLLSAGDTITVSSLPARRFLRFLVVGIATGGTVDISMRFNGDSASNYTTRYASNNGTDSSNGSLSSIGLDTAVVPTGQMIDVKGEITNIATSPKLVSLISLNSGTAGAANAIEILDLKAKWVNTSSLISSITVTNAGTGDLAIGSEVVVLGHN